jgi:hypothetical protein
MKIYRNNGDVVPFGPLTRVRTVFQSVRYTLRPRKGISFLSYRDWMEQVVPQRAEILSRRLGQTVNTFGPMLYKLGPNEQTRITDGLELAPELPGWTKVQSWFDEKLDQTLHVYCQNPPATPEDLERLAAWARK